MMKTQLLATLAATMISVSALAMGPADSPKLDRIFERLQLDQSQQSAVEQILSEQGQTRKALRDKHFDDRENHREQTQSRLANVLTAEQLSTFQREMRRGKGHKACGKKGPGFKHRALQGNS